MADQENNNTETSSDQASAQQDQEAQLLDGLTVLARDGNEQETPFGEALGGTHQDVDDGGYENLQSDVRIVDDRGVALIDENGFKSESNEVERNGNDSGVIVPPNPSDSEGHKDPVPFIDQPLPAAEIDFNQGSEGNDDGSATPESEDEILGDGAQNLSLDAGISDPASPEVPVTPVGETPPPDTFVPPAVAQQPPTTKSPQGDSDSDNDTDTDTDTDTKRIIKLNDTETTKILSCLGEIGEGRKWPVAEGEDTLDSPESIWSAGL